MKRRTIPRGKTLFVILSFVFLALAACTREAALLPRVWIDYPRQNLRVAPDQPVVIHSHAYAGSGLAEVVLSVDGVAYKRTQPLEAEDKFSEFQQEWLPPGEGTYLLQVVAYDVEGVRSNPVIVALVVGMEELTADQPAEPPAEEPEEAALQETCPPQATVNNNANCRSGPGEDYPLLSSLPAGTRATVVGQSQDGYWWVVDPPDKPTCWIWEELVSLSNENCQVTQVESPPPPQDQTPPPIPEPAVPANGLSLSCRATQNLAWLPVEDESGIAGYDLKLEKELSSGSWQVVNQWSQVQGKQLQVQVDCGLQYRWSVRAVDGEGNLSSWSAYSSFIVDLD